MKPGYGIFQSAGIHTAEQAGKLSELRRRFISLGGSLYNINGMGAGNKRKQPEITLFNLYHALASGCFNRSDEKIFRMMLLKVVCNNADIVVNVRRMFKHCLVDPLQDIMHSVFTHF